MFVCNDYETDDIYFNKELLKLSLEQKQLNKDAFKLVSDYIYNYIDNNDEIQMD